MLYVQLTMTFKVTGFRSTDDLDDHLDALMESLLQFEDGTLINSDVSAALADGIVEVSIVAQGEDFDSAADKAQACILDAIQSAGGETPGWRKIESSSRELIAS